MPPTLMRTWAQYAATAAAAVALACLAPRAALAQTGIAQIRAGDMPVTLVYPTDAPNRPIAMGPFTLEVAPNAAPLRGNGRLVVMSHGTGGSPLTEHDLARTLAAAGFVVAQPEHRGDTWRDLSLSGPESWKRRPAEVSRTIDAVLADARFAPLLDGGKVGVYGMSAGGLTGLAVAGGEWSVAALLRHCAAHQVDDAGFCFFGVRDAAARGARAAAYADPVLPAGADTVQGGAGNPRIAAVAVAVPVAAVVSTDSLARIQVPVGVVEGPRDTVLQPALHARRVLADCGRCTALGAVAGAGHYEMLSPVPAAAARQMGIDPNFDNAQLQASHVRVAAFFRQHLVQAPAAPAR